MSDPIQTPDGELEDLSLETPSSTEGELTDNPDALNRESTTTEVQQQKYKLSLSERISKFAHGINVYLIAFIVIMVIAIIVIFVANNSNDGDGGASITSQELSEEAIQELLQTENNVGDVSQTLTVEANAVFNGKILIKDNLDVAGSISVGGPLTLPGITVAGTSAFDEVEVNNNLSISGNASLQGSLSVGSGLSVIGDTAIEGNLSATSINTNNLQFNGDLQTQRHIDTGGPTPGASSGGSVGSGGTASVSGTDSSGTVTINTGAGPGAGTLANVTFAANYNGTPRVIITPVGPASAALDVYVTRSTSGFSISTLNAPSGANTYIFDYWVVE